MTAEEGCTGPAESPPPARPKFHPALFCCHNRWSGLEHFMPQAEARKYQSAWTDDITGKVWVKIRPLHATDTCGAAFPANAWGRAYLAWRAEEDRVLLERLNSVQPKEEDH